MISQWKSSIRALEGTPALLLLHLLSSDKFLVRLYIWFYLPPPTLWSSDLGTIPAPRQGVTSGNFMGCWSRVLTHHVHSWLLLESSCGQVFPGCTSHRISETDGKTTSAGPWLISRRHSWCVKRTYGEGTTHGKPRHLNVSSPRFFSNEQCMFHLHVPTLKFPWIKAQMLFA